MLQAFEAVERPVRLHRDQLHRGLLLLQPPAGAHERAARAEAGDEVRDAPAGLGQDLDGGRVVVRPPVGLVAVLVGVEVALGLEREQPPRLADGAVRSFERVGPDDVGAVDVEQPLALARDVRRHAQLDRVAQGGAQHRQRDAGVAGRGVEQRLAGHQRAGAQALADHRGGGAILHRPARIARLELGVDLDPRVGLDAAEPGQRRVADQRPHGALERSSGGRDGVAGRAGGRGGLGAIGGAHARHGRCRSVGRKTKRPGSITPPGLGFVVAVVGV